MFKLFGSLVLHAPFPDNDANYETTDCARMRISAYAFVIMASGKLSRMLKRRKPMAKRFRNAPVNAEVLSEKDKGIIEAAESAPTRDRRSCRTKCETSQTPVAGAERTEPN